MSTLTNDIYNETKKEAQEEREWQRYLDRLLTANHRNHMINRYRYTDAMSIKIEDLTKSSI